jgi:hypothetical protein
MYLVIFVLLILLVTANVLIVTLVENGVEYVVWADVVLFITIYWGVMRKMYFW